MELKKPIAYSIYHLFWCALDWLFPPYCCQCGQLGARLCEECQQSIAVFDENICTICGKPQNKPGVCLSCKSNPPPFTNLRSWAHYEGVLRNAIHEFKYHNNIALGEYLAHFLIELLSKQNWEIDMITAVPISRQRQNQRRYNQAAMLAYPMALASNTKFVPEALIRKQHTTSQVNLSAKERKANVKNAFYADDSIVINKNILIIDDITTTEATIRTCSQKLKDAGAQNIYAITLARANLHKTNNLHHNKHDAPKDNIIINTLLGG